MCYVIKFKMTDITDKYVLPQRRGKINGGKINGNKANRKKCYGNDTNVQRRRDFSQSPTFNVKPIITESSEKLHTEIIIPEVIEPSVIKPYINELGSKTNSDDDLLRRLEAIKQPLGEVVIIQKTGISETEAELLRNLAMIRKDHIRREAQKDFDEWVSYYELNLYHMYETCVDNDFGLTYNGFVQLAYKCTDTAYNTKKLKYTRPLI